MKALGSIFVLDFALSTYGGFPCDA